MGTYGYAAPDYIETGHLTAKSDVWSFGVVLYEILAGRRSLERNKPKTEQKLLEWVKHYPPDSKKFELMIDSRLEGQYPINAARKIAKLADHCLRKSAKDRPTMSQVVERLKEIIQTSDEEQHPSSENMIEEVSENDPVESEETSNEEKSNQLASAELRRKRMEHLAKLGEHVDSASRRRFMIQQRANVNVSS